MTHLSPSSGSDPGDRRPQTDRSGLTPDGEHDLLNGAALHAPSMNVIMARSAPAELHLAGVSYEDACRVINEALLPDEDLPLPPHQLREFVRSTARGLSLDSAELAELAPEFGDLIVRQRTSIGCATRKLHEESEVEFAMVDSTNHGCSVAVSHGDSPDRCDITLDWGLSLDYQSDRSLLERWELVQAALLVAGEIDTATCKTRSLDATAKRFQLEDRAVIQVVDRDLRSANPSADPHLSQRPDLIPICALQLLDEEEDDPTADLVNRFVHLHGELSKVCTGLRNELDLEEAMVSRSQLEQLGEAPFLWNSESEVVIISVESYLLVVTKASTGLTLLADIEALERYASKTRSVDSTPDLKALTAIQSTDFVDSQLAPIFTALNVPSQDYFIAALRDYVDSEDPTARGRIRDGILDSVIAGHAVTIELSRNFYIAGKELNEALDEEETSDIEEDASEDGEGAEVSDAESPAWEQTPGRIGVTRAALVVPSTEDDLARHPVIGFLPADESNIPGSFTKTDSPMFMVTVSAQIDGLWFIPYEIADKTLRSLGLDPSRVSILAAKSDPATGEHEGYLSKSVRVYF